MLLLYPGPFHAQMAFLSANRSSDTQPCLQALQPAGQEALELKQKLLAHFQGPKHCTRQDPVCHSHLSWASVQADSPFLNFMGRVSKGMQDQVKHCYLHEFVLVQEIDQLHKIFRVLGTPNEAMWPGVSRNYIDFKDTFPKWRPRPFPQVRPSVSLYTEFISYNASTCMLEDSLYYTNGFGCSGV